MIVILLAIFFIAIFCAKEYKIEVLVFVLISTIQLMALLIPCASERRHEFSTENYTQKLLACT